MRNEETATTTISVIHWGVSKLQCTVSFRRKSSATVGRLLYLPRKARDILSNFSLTESLSGAFADEPSTVPEAIFQ